MFAQLGDVKFELLNSFTVLEETHAAHFAKHDVLKGRPRLQAMGNDLTELRFGIKLHWKLGDVDTAYKGLIAAKEAQQAVSLVYGSGRFVGWFVIERLTARTTQMDAQGRTAARELDVDLSEFVGDPNNPLPTPAVLSGSQNPLLAMLPESVQSQVSPIVENVQKAVKVYRTVEKEVGDVQRLIQAAKELKNDPVGALQIIGDVVGVAGGALGKLNGLPEITDKLGDLSGVAAFATQAAQATHQLGDAVGGLRAGYESGTVGGWLIEGSNAVDAAAESLSNGAAALQSLTAFIAARKDA
ncbi:phage tail protein [Neisseriaceae bacterium B1]